MTKLLLDAPSVGIIGGADGPTKIIVAGDWSAVALRGILVIALVFAAIFAIKRWKKKKSDKK